MNLIQKGHRHTHRGIIGIESAIVLIAFVIVAAALAFVVLNMGFSTTQKAKTTIVSTLAEAGSSLEIEGKVNGFAPFISTSLENAVGRAANPAEFNYITADPYVDGTWPIETTAFIYWTVQSNTNDILERGEHANVAIVFATGDKPQELDTIRLEIIPPAGASLTISRQIPNITTEVVDLG